MKCFEPKEDNYKGDWEELIQNIQMCSTSSSVLSSSDYTVKLKDYVARTKKEDGARSHSLLN